MFLIFPLLRAISGPSSPQLASKMPSCWLSCLQDGFKLFPRLTHIYTYIDMCACRLVGVLSRKGHGMDATRTVLDWTHLSKMFALIQDGRFLPDPVACNMSPLGRRRGPALRA